MLEKTFYVPGPLKEQTQPIVPLYFPFPWLLVIEYSGGMCDSYESLEVQYRLKISPIDKTYSGDRILTAQYCPCSSFNCHTLNFKHNLPQIQVI